MEKNENAEQLLKERVLRLKTVTELKEPDRVPIFFPTETWLASYTGYTVQQIIYDYNKMIKAIEKSIQEYQWDCVWGVGSIWPAQIFDAVGRLDYAASGSAFQVPDESYMTPEEYPELIADPYTFIVEKIMPRRCPELAKTSPRNAIALGKGASAFALFRSQMGAVAKGWLQAFGIPLLVSGKTHPPFDMVSYCRGLKGLLLDTKRHPDLVKEACEALLPISIKYAMISHRVTPGGFSTVFVPPDAAILLSPSSFEKFYWPTFSKLMEAICEKDYNAFMMLEGNWEPYFDFLAQLPKGKIIAWMESTDMEKAKAVIGKTMCIAGDIPCALLGYGTEKEVIQYTRNLIDKMAPGGGFIVCSDKEMISHNDAKPENLLAVTKFVKEYGVYRK